MQFVAAVLTLVLFVVTLVDIIRRPDDQVRFLPKFVWLIIAILIPFIGSLLWWALGRDWSQSSIPQRVAPQRAAAEPKQPQRPAPRRVDVRTTEQQLADLEREEKEERLRAEIARRRREKGLDA